MLLILHSDAPRCGLLLDGRYLLLCIEPDFQGLFSGILRVCSIAVIRLLNPTSCQRKTHHLLIFIHSCTALFMGSQCDLSHLSANNSCSVSAVAILLLVLTNC